MCPSRTSAGRSGPPNRKRRLNDDERCRCKREHLRTDADDPEQPADQPTRAAKQTDEKRDAEAQRPRRRACLQRLQGQADVEQCRGDEGARQTEQQHHGTVTRDACEVPLHAGSPLGQATTGSGYLQGPAHERRGNHSVPTGPSRSRHTSTRGAVRVNEVPLGSLHGLHLRRRHRSDDRLRDHPCGDQRGSLVDDEPPGQARVGVVGLLDSGSSKTPSQGTFPHAGAGEACRMRWFAAG